VVWDVAIDEYTKKLVPQSQYSNQFFNEKKFIGDGHGAVSIDIGPQEK